MKRYIIIILILSIFTIKLHSAEALPDYHKNYATAGCVLSYVGMGIELASYPLLISTVVFSSYYFIYGMIGSVGLGLAGFLLGQIIGPLITCYAYNTIKKDIYGIYGNNPLETNTYFYYGLSWAAYAAYIGTLIGGIALLFHSENPALFVISGLFLAAALVLRGFSVTIPVGKIYK